jgi:hypothetical protein
MIRKLLIVFASGLVLSVLLLCGAWVVGGQELVDHFEKDGGWNIQIDTDDDATPRMTRTLPFDDSKLLVLNGPVNLHFTRGDTSQITVKGAPAVVNNLKLDGGKLTLGPGKGWQTGGLDVTITAPRLIGLELNGASDVELTGLDQPDLTIDARGAVNLDATGKVGKLAVSSRGAGDIDLGEVEAVDASVDVAGVGNVDINASGAVTAKISGAGDISLHRRPKVLSTSISGFGSIDHDYPGGE